MKLVYAHFPINATVAPDNSSIEIKNFLGGRQIKHVDMIEGVKVKMSDIKDEIHFEGFDNAAVSLCCARVSQSVSSGKKDNRKFLDGIYVCHKGLIAPKE